MSPTIAIVRINYEIFYIIIGDKLIVIVISSYAITLIDYVIDQFKYSIQTPYSCISMYKTMTESIYTYT